MSSVAKIAKPKLRNLLTSQVKRDFAIAFGLSGIGAIGWQIFVKDARKQKYADYYKTFDAEQEFDKMMKEGVFKCVDPDGNPRGNN